MSFEFKPGVRYRMPVVFGPAPGPRQKADGSHWKPEETGVMNAHWMTLAYRTAREKLDALLPAGFTLRGEPIVHVSLSYFRNLYWLAGRGYGIVKVDVPVTYAGKSETIDGAFCLSMWEGLSDAVLTGREELGFPKLFADIPELDLDIANGAAGGEASWLDFKFFEMKVKGLEPVTGDHKLPGPGGADMHFKYMPRTGPFGSGGGDVAYVTTSYPAPGTVADASPIKFDGAQFKKWKGTGGSISWHRARFEDLPTTFHIINGLADLDILEVVGAEMIEFSAPGVAVTANVIRPVEPKD